ncbi:hypothetical protein [[Ruminococcus] lactaris]|uniref:hypothetical protein n=1 Tax=[Ruminococcus] lactaris TaxID=46228 RepID=UPI001FAD08CC|nr:hypothetical protein [[Ruminococcus] lactaris]
MKIKLIDFGVPEHQRPYRPHGNDAGADVYLPYDCTLQPGEIAKIPLGFGLEIPDGYKAFYSLDRDEGIEREILQKPLNPAEIWEQRQMTELIYKGLSKLPVKQRQRIYAHFFLGMSKADIAKAEGTHKSRITRSIEAGLRSLEKYFKEIL